MQSQTNSCPLPIPPPTLPTFSPPPLPHPRPPSSFSISSYKPLFIPLANTGLSSIYLFEFFSLRRRYWKFSVHITKILNAGIFTEPILPTYPILPCQGHSRCVSLSILYSTATPYYIFVYSRELSSPSKMNIFCWYRKPSPWVSKEF